MGFTSRCRFAIHRFRLAILGAGDPSAKEMTQLITDKEIKQYHLKKLFELSLKSIGEIPQLVEPDEEQKQWIEFRLSDASSWPKVHEKKLEIIRIGFNRG